MSYAGGIFNGPNDQRPSGELQVVLDSAATAKTEASNPVLSQILEGQNQILASQWQIFNKILELEQRCSRIEQIVDRQYENLNGKQIGVTRGLGESAKTWFEKSFKVKGFEVKISSEDTVGTKMRFTLPIINKAYQSAICIKLRWIRNDTPLEAAKKEVDEMVQNQMKLFLKNCSTGVLSGHHPKISPVSVDITWADHSLVYLRIDHPNFPLTRNNKSLLRIGLANENDPEPAILVDDIVNYSKIELHKTSQNRIDFI